MTLFSDLEGKTLSSVVVDDDSDDMVFITTDGDQYRLGHNQYCCESVYIEDINGDIDDLVGHEILVASEVSHTDKFASESGTWTFYKLATNKGWVDIRWYGSSNGYYSESVDFCVVPHNSIL